MFNKRLKELFPWTSIFSVWRTGETLALNHLKKCGYLILEQNWRSKAGEIDIVAANTQELVFVEVKTRVFKAKGHPNRQEVLKVLDNITETKRKKLRLLAEIYLAFYYKGAKLPRYRIDVIGVLIDGDTHAQLEMEHVIGAI